MKTADELKIIHIGATPSELGMMFNMTPQEVNRRLTGKVVPAKTEHKLPRYRIDDAAPYLCNPKFDVEEYLKGLPPSKLPPQLNKAFWAGMRERQDYEENLGDLWRTERVMEVVSEAFKTVNMTLQMMEDTVGQKAELTPVQRRIIIEIVEGLRGNLQKNLQNAFKNYRQAEDEHGAPVAEALLALEDDIDDGLDD
jgi:hypothetical protein